MTISAKMGKRNQERRQ